MTKPTRWRVDCVVGARPNFVKIAPIMRAFRADGRFAVKLIHTGQHYDVAMNEVFFRELAIASPDVNLEVGSGTGTEQTARIMLGLEPVFTADRPDILVVVGDVNSTMAATLVAAKLLIPVVHVEAGLRSGDRTMPEEVNRLVTDRLADLLLTTESEAADNLLKEGIAADRIAFVGNVMIDTLRASLERTRSAHETLRARGASEHFIADASQGFGFVTLHRPSNVDDPTVLKRLLTALGQVAQRLPLVFAVHPRTEAAIAAGGLASLISSSRVLVTPPLTYLEAVGLMREAKLAITDSGGVQEETTALGVPCITVRENTERPITVHEGTNILVGRSPEKLIAAADEAISNGGKRGRIPDKWDGQAARRAVEHVAAFLARA